MERHLPFTKTNVTSLGGGQSVRVGEQTYGNDKTVKVLQLNPLAAQWTKVEPTLRERSRARSCSCGSKYLYLRS